MGWWLSLFRKNGNMVVRKAINMAACIGEIFYVYRDMAYVNVPIAIRDRNIRQPGGEEQEAHYNQIPY
jgi:hypothetical protein